MLFGFNIVVPQLFISPHIATAFIIVSSRIPGRISPNLCNQFISIMNPADGGLSQDVEVMALIAGLRKDLSVNDPAGPATRRHLKELAEQLSMAHETPGETVQRVAYYIGTLFNLNLPQDKHKLSSAMRIRR